ncbi:glutathione synthetase-like [Aplysia californica]|uniref:Glutathione synthetase n=1 Tax=Aplysia californica TaxID=6500 RepID=A0ABM0JSA4_APLCA|nr:glutathione synthetase-like [Aplysia californica]
MATSIQEVDLSDKRLQEILSVTNDWALCNGISIGSGADGVESEKVLPAPYSLFPSVVPAPILEHVKSTMTHFNRLMHKVSMDHEFLEQSLKNVIQVDPFMQSFWEVYCKVRESGIKQPLHLGLFRNDFMMNCLDDSVCPNQIVSTDRQELKQIEFNTVSASCGGIAGQMADLHRLSLGMAGKDLKPEQLPDNKPAVGLADGLVKAWELYGNPRAVIIFVVSTSERNVIDQRWVEFKVYDRNPNIRILRKTFLDIYNHGYLDDHSRLIIDGDEVALIYLRDGYTAENYTSQKEWDARLKCELSRAIKCPSVQLQLTGAKKIQQELTRPGALERFVSDPQVVNTLRDTFADQYSLDLNQEGDAAVKLALLSPEKFVLKPQREGGGNNLYNEDITTFFKEHNGSKERSAYILMQRIFPWQQKNYLVKPGVPFALSDVVSELGVYGVYIGSADSEVVNFECGYLMRTKNQGSDEGGIFAGFAVWDNPLVI